MLTVRKKPFFIRVISELFYFCARPLQKSYWFLFRPYRPGAKTFIFYQNKLLLARLGYAHKSWVLPGGGIEKRETPEQAAVREVQEEVGLEILNPQYIFERSNTRQYKKVTVFYYTITVDNEDVVIDGQEIVDARWFELDQLPFDIRDVLRDEIQMYNKWKYETS